VAPLERSIPPQAA